jgi:hypothetical protein
MSGKGTSKHKSAKQSETAAAEASTPTTPAPTPLHQAMARDTTGHLQTLVSGYAAATDAATRASVNGGGLHERR